MSEVQPAPEPPAKPKSRRKLVLVMIAVIVIGIGWLVVNVLTWDPNYVSVVHQAHQLFLKSGEGVYLIGVEPPPVEELKMGKPARDYVASCIESRHIRIKLDERPKDEAGYILAYVFYTAKDGKERFLNEDLLRLGYARATPLFPNLKYRKLFEEAEAEAKAKKLGIWADGYKFPGH